MHALVQLRDPSVFEPLVQALKDASPDVREQAAFGLGQLRDRRAVEPLVSAAEGRERRSAANRPSSRSASCAIRGGAWLDRRAEGCGRRRPGAGGVRARPDPRRRRGRRRWRSRSRTQNPDVREQAVFALGQIRDPRAVEPAHLRAQGRQRRGARAGRIRARPAARSRAVEALVIALKDTDPDVREQVVFALGQIRDPRAIDALTLALKDANAERPPAGGVRPRSTRSITPPGMAAVMVTAASGRGAVR